MRNLIVPLILVGVFGLSVGSALAAQEVSLHKHTAEELKSVCDKAGGRFSQDAGGVIGRSLTSCLGTEHQGANLLAQASQGLTLRNQSVTNM
jgi:hypothetical protein